MHFRPLGNTGLSLSVVGLGGHFRASDGGRYCDAFPGDEVPAEVARNRADVVSACLDAGINYIDITTSAECLAYGLALRGRRDRVVLGADDYAWGARDLSGCTPPRLVENVERCLRRLRTDRLDLWRATTDMKGRNTDDHVAAMLEAADRLRAAGKIRFFAVASHHPGWLRRIAVTFDGIDALFFPCTGLTDRLVPVKPSDADIAPTPGAQSPTRAGKESLFHIVHRRRLGLITIKPFAGGALFAPEHRPSRPTLATDEPDRLARLTLRHILAHHREVTGIVAGMNTPAEVEHAVTAVRHCRDDITPEQTEWLRQLTRSRLDALPDDYRWLRHWDCV